MENGGERQVKTPWYEYEIPFTKAAEIGTRKVIRDHATIGVVVTTDGSVAGLPRENYIEPEEKTVRELKEIGKPFVILLNCIKPYTDEAQLLSGELQRKYGACVVPVNCEQMKPEEIHEIMRQVLYGFPVTEVEFYIPRWVEMLPRDHRIKADLLVQVKNFMGGIGDVRSAVDAELHTDSEYNPEMSLEKIEMDTGRVRIQICYEEKYYYEVLSEMAGTEIRGEYELISLVRELSSMRRELSSVKDAFTNVKMKGYGVVTPSREEIRLDAPVIIKQGSKFGVRIHSEAPSIHMIRANIETEIAPIVGSEQQAPGSGGLYQKGKRDAGRRLGNQYIRKDGRRTCHGRHAE